ncbi:cupin domain-containing protein [Paenibacillus sp. MER 180]|uniref:cupin domain-containing protein n=1 Tax=unclassified Paenibacillus TaxID=185978 RepID=UPI0008065F62|nr:MULTISPECIES: cupin domain-containing protein [unclassified Paenibacillus]MCM3291025.1 cupin domain-containing protein [Paenibacillus sp. MER 180]OBY77926.1 ethanolamine utilization protein EutQ [Paenibacillus sp. KS1]
MSIDKKMIEEMVRNIIMEKIAADAIEQNVHRGPGGITSVKVPNMKVTEEDRLDTGNPNDIVYCKDLFSLQESPRLGCGIMEMKETTFDWTLNYDEVDYVIEGHLDVIIDGTKVSAGPGEVILIPNGSKIQFSVPEYARFIYVTYPANWAEQA